MATQAIEFDNTNSERAEANGEGNAITEITGDFTVELWVKMTSLDHGFLVANPGNETDGCTFNIGHHGTNNEFWYLIRDTSNSWQTCYSNSTVSKDTWYHVAATWDNSEQVQKFYVDGVEQDDSNSNFTPKRNTLDYFVVGAQRVSGGPGQYADAIIDELRISDTVRYTSGFTPSTTEFESDANTVALYHFNDNANDSGPNEIDLTEYNTPTYTDGKVEEAAPSGPPINTLQMMGIGK